MPSAARSFTSVLKLELKVILKRGRKRKFYLDTIWINTLLRPPLSKVYFLFKATATVVLAGPNQPYTKLK